MLKKKSSSSSSSIVTQKIANRTLGLTEVGVFHGLLGSQSLLMVVTQQLIQQIQRFGAHQVLILWLDKVLPAFSRLPKGFFECRMSDIIGAYM